MSLMLSKFIIELVPYLFVLTVIVINMYQQTIFCTVTRRKQKNPKHSCMTYHAYINDYSKMHLSRTQRIYADRSALIHQQTNIS